MSPKALIVTTISAPNAVLEALGRVAHSNAVPFFIVGDEKSPPEFAVLGATFVSIEQQTKRFPTFSKALPRNHYVRKNIGYLLAVELGVAEIQETDDDNMPRPEFWTNPVDGNPIEIVCTESGWFNVYTLFTNEIVWPRGFPLEQINHSAEFTLKKRTIDGFGLIRQGLADDNPDVDAVFRLTRKLPLRFSQRSPVMLPPGVWAPFNSQNTIFERAAFPLLYLPSHCSFRMTDIWRSFVAQRCLWELDQGVVFHSATVSQCRNNHSLLQDLQDETPGYLLNDKIRRILEGLRLNSSDMWRNLAICYEALVENNVLHANELINVREWERAFLSVCR